MRRLSVTLRVAVFTSATVALIGCDGSRQVDTILRGAIVYDGSGSVGRRADVAIGSVANLSGRQEIKLDGRAISPGFVDIHSHADLILLAGEPDRGYP